MEYTKYIELAKKIKLLADQGIGGEAVAAKHHLDLLMRKYHITPADLENEEKRVVWFTIHPQYRRLFTQVVISVCGSDVEFYQYKNSRKPHQRGVRLTKLQEIEVRVKYDFYLQAYKDDMEVFFSAFIQKNHLLPPNCGVTRPDDLSKEELERALKVLRMQEGIDSHQYLKELGGGK